MRSGKYRSKILASLTPDQMTAAANGAGVDLLGFDENVISIVTGAFGGTTPTATFKVQHSADNTTFSDVADVELDGVTGNGAGVALAASSVVTAAYIGNRRFVRVILAAVGGTSPVIRVGASVVRTAPKLAP